MSDESEASRRISERIAELDDWRGQTLGRIRALIQEAVPDVLEESKWMGTPVWSHDGVVCRQAPFVARGSYAASGSPRRRAFGRSL